VRTLRTAAVATLVAAATLAFPAAASADGGAYISFDRTHYLVGETAVGEGYVYVPKQHQDLLDEGPFHGYLDTSDAAGGDLRLGTVTFERFGRTEFELRLSFTVPDVVGDSYTVRVCNDPCTVAGFREPLTGEISIVHTAREAELLTANTKLDYRNYALARKLRKAERAGDALQAELDEALAARDRYALEIATLRAAASPASAPVGASTGGGDIDAGRPLTDAWTLVVLGGAVLLAALAIGLALVFSRRHQPRIVIPNTIGELAVAPDPEPVARR